MKLMNIKAAFFAIGAALALTGCQSAGGRVTTLQSSNVSIAAGATYAWAPLAPNELQNGDPRIDNDIIRQRIRAAVDTNLQARGFRPVSDPAEAQMLVSYHVGLENRTDVRVDSMGGRGSAACGWRGCVGGFGWGMYGAPTNVRTVRYTEGTLIVDLTDRASGELAWRGTSQRRVDNNAASQDTLNAIVADVVRSLPSMAPAS